MIECCSEGDTRKKSFRANVKNLNTSKRLAGKGAEISVTTQVSRCHNCRSEPEPINTREYSTVIWTGNRCQLHSVLSKTDAKHEWVFDPVWKANLAGLSESEPEIFSLTSNLIAFPICGLWEVYKLTAVAKKIYWCPYWCVDSKWRPVHLSATVLRTWIDLFHLFGLLHHLDCVYLSPCKDFVFRYVCRTLFKLNKVSL